MPFRRPFMRTRSHVSVMIFNMRRPGGRGGGEEEKQERKRQRFKARMYLHRHRHMDLPLDAAACSIVASIRLENTAAGLYSTTHGKLNKSWMLVTVTALQ